ncbi:BRAP2 RING ZnF UBP domain-containing protein 2, partial [Camellia lanceoleosa]
LNRAKSYKMHMSTVRVVYESIEQNPFFRHFTSPTLKIYMEQLEKWFNIGIFFSPNLSGSQTSFGVGPKRFHLFFSFVAERLEQDMSGILTTICNHSFHCSCISKWADSSCPVIGLTWCPHVIAVCRYCAGTEKSICFVCQTFENLWICVICGFVGCGRYEGHSIRHWKETQHCYSLELDTQRVWDYAGDNYLVELNHYCAHANDGCGSYNCSIDTGFSETLLNSKVENIVNEYSELLTTQLENQKIKAASGNQKLQKMQAKLDKCDQEKSFFDEINKSLLKNQDILKASIVEIEEREKKTLKLKDDKIREFEEQDMVVGGTDTTSNTIEFALVEMMNKPQVLRKAQQEAETVVGKDNIVEESHIHKLPYLYAVMKETLRLHPALPLLVPHCPTESCIVGGYTVPKGARVFVNVWVVHRDPSVWKNPLQFDPERFFGDSKWDYSGNDFNYFPFGSGRRICTGTAIAERMSMFSLPACALF